MAYGSPFGDLNSPLTQIREEPFALATVTEEMYIYNNIISKVPTFAGVLKNQRSIYTSVFPHLFRATPLLCAEPLKKKKKLDPAILKAREDRKKRRFEKEIRKLERNALQFKPIDELEVSSEIKNNLQKLTRPKAELAEEEVDRRHYVVKRWGVYKLQQHHEDLMMVNTVLKAKEKALQELRSESESLYTEAIQPDLHLLPFRCKGPVETAPIAHFDPVDGDYKDVSKKWE